jgi:hypothetical protein
MLVVGLLIGIGVCVPFLASGRIYLLDWSIGPTTPIVSSGTLGLYGGLTSGVASSLITGLLNWSFGSASTWLPVFSFFPLAFLGVGRLVGGSLNSRIAAGTLYVANPFVFNRLYVGHIPLLIGYALLPFAVKATLQSGDSMRKYSTFVALWWSGLTALSPHFAWIFGVVVLASVIIGLVKDSIRRTLVGLVMTLAGFSAMSTYLLLPHLATKLPVQAGKLSLALYQTSGDPRLGIFPNVAGLYGFWRLGPGPVLPKSVVSGWAFMLVALLLIVATGVWAAFGRSEDQVAVVGTSRSDDLSSQDTDDLEPSSRAEPILDTSNHGADRRRVASLMSVVGFGGFLLALGSQGPTGAIFAWSYSHVPFFEVMREPQKFLMLLALAYSVFFGWGVGYLSRLARLPRRVLSVATAIGLGVVLPLSYTPTIFDGLNGQLALSKLPIAYQTANRVMGKGEGNILALPWHNYMEYPFTDGRVVADVTTSVFSRSVISGDNVESGDVKSQSTSLRSSYLQSLFSLGGSLHQFGTLIAPLGVEFIVLSKTVDWASYSWLSAQPDLQLVSDNSALEVWRNLSYQGISQPVARLSSVSDLPGLLRAVSKSHSGFGLVSIDVMKQAANLSGGRDTAPVVGSGQQYLTKVAMLSPIAYRISSGTPGWVEIAAPYEVGWSINGVSTLPTIQGSMLVHVGAKAGVLTFGPWGSARLGYLISGGIFALLFALVMVDRRFGFL